MREEASLLKQAGAIWSAGLEAVRPDRLLKGYLRLRDEKLVIGTRSFRLSAGGRIYLISLGKAASPMASAAAEVLGPRLAEGLVIGLPGEAVDDPRLVYLASSHPLPDARSLRAARAALGLARKAEKNDLVLVLLSGGGSALACLPAPGVSLAEKRGLTARLLGAGATIADMNTVRKHLSAFKGGRLAQAAWPALTVSLALSDVPRNDLSVIASGPSCWDPSTYSQAISVLERFGLWKGAPHSIRRTLTAGCAGRIPETPKRADPVFRRVLSYVIGDNATALKAAARRAERLGFGVRILPSPDSGEARDAASHYARLLDRCWRDRHAPAQKACLLAGGELTVTVHGRGRGGRNTEFALALLREAEARGWGTLPIGWFAASLGTDGIDGCTEAAGAFISREVLEAARRRGLDPQPYLAANNSYVFFRRVGGLILTGPTHTNVMDLRVFLSSPPARPRRPIVPGSRFGYNTSS